MRLMPHFVEQFEAYLLQIGEVMLGFEHHGLEVSLIYFAFLCILFVALPFLGFKDQYARLDQVLFDLEEEHFDDLISKCEVDVFGHRHAEDGIKYSLRLQVKEVDRLVANILKTLTLLRQFTDVRERQVNIFEDVSLLLFVVLARTCVCLVDNRIRQLVQ